MNVRIEKYVFGNSAHDESVTRLLERVFIGEGFAPPLASSQFGAMTLRERGTAWIALVNDAVAGTIFLVPATNRFRQAAAEPEQEVHLLAVDPEQRKGGVALALLRALTLHAKSEGVPALVLSTQPTMTAAHALYRREGFVRAPDRDWKRPDGRPYWVFTKTL